jgi:hypothetical protein
MVDASAGIQGVLVQHRYGRAVMSGFFACYTAAAIAGALVMSALVGAGSGPGAGGALVLAAVVLVGALLLGRPRLVGSDLPLARGAGAGESVAAVEGVPGIGVEAVEAVAAAPGGAEPGPAPRLPLPTRGILLFGCVVLAAFVADSAVSTWSTVYLHDTLAASAGVAPLGYAAYQAAILLTRLAGDRVVARVGRPPVVAVTGVAAVLGLLLVALVPQPAAAVAGFAVVGIGVGALVPLAFSAAGELDPARVDEVIARINLFNYAGAVLGAVLVGLLADGPGLGPAFLLPALLVAPTVVSARRFAVRG